MRSSVCLQCVLKFGEHLKLLVEFFESSGSCCLGSCLSAARFPREPCTPISGPLWSHDDYRPTNSWVFTPGPIVPHHDVFLFSFLEWGGVRLSPSGTSATIGLLYQPRMIDDDEYGAVGGMRFVRGNRSVRRKPAPVPFRPPQIRTAAVGSRRLSA
jgi:hypothetical protein